MKLVSCSLFTLTVVRRLHSVHLYLYDGQNKHQQRDCTKKSRASISGEFKTKKINDETHADDYGNKISQQWKQSVEKKLHSAVPGTGTCTTILYNENKIVNLN